MEFDVKTPNNNIKIEVFSGFIRKEKIRADKEKFSDMCKKCRNYNQKYSCPPRAPKFEDICGREGLFIVLMRIKLNQINSGEYNKVQLANSVLKSRIDKAMRILEQELSAKYLSSGSCRLCKPCNLQKNLPCRHPGDMRFSLESAGIDCDYLSQTLFNFPLLWFKEGKAPEYACVLAGLICDEKDKEKSHHELTCALNKLFINPFLQ